MKSRGRAVCGGLVLAFLVIGAPVVRGEEKAVFDLEEVSPFALQEKPDYAFYSAFLSLMVGESAGCLKKPEEHVRAYPELKSQKPLYGTVAFDRDYDKPDSGIRFSFVLDESAGTATGYDRLYLDLDRDNDLTNDQPLTSMKEPPTGARPSWQVEQMVFFDYAHVRFEFGPNLGSRPVRLLPRLAVSESGHAALTFVATEARGGEIQIGPHRYDLVLGQSHPITGRFDKPSTTFLLTDRASGEREEWWGADSLRTMRVVDGTWYSFSTTPRGDKLAVHPYGGEFGVFEVGPGDRDINNLRVKGSLRSEHAAVPVGKVDPKRGWPEGTRRTELPVGDYLPRGLWVEFGRLSIFISKNYHSDGHPRDRQGRPPVHGIQIRQDRPFVLDFSNEPEVMFASPAKGVRLRPGETLEVNAVLIDPVLDVMIRGLDDTTRSQKRTFTTADTADGRTYTLKEKLSSLDPTVSITDSSGKEVATGVMPFG